jgi:hypothetical protein
MTAPLRVPPRSMRITLAAAIWSLLVVALIAASAAEAKSKETVNLCVTMSGPEKGNVRFTPGVSCKKGEQSVPVVTRAGQQGVLGVAERSGQPSTTGPRGPRGERGPAGEPGSRGAAGAGVGGPGILNGSGAPSAAVGGEGDFYIDTDSHDIFGPKLAEDWSDGISLIGPAGPQGESGPAGPEGPAGPQGEPGLGAPAVATAAAPGSRSADAYGGLAGGGSNPSVTLATGTSAMVTVTGFVDPASGSSGYLSFAVSGASDQPASDERAVIHELPPGADGGGVQASTTTVVTDLSAGSNTFTLLYKGSASFANRTISVVPLG